jgi:hypothetical protein
MTGWIPQVLILITIKALTTGGRGYSVLVVVLTLPWASYHSYNQKERKYNYLKYRTE